MAIVDRHIATNAPYSGLTPDVLDVLDQFIVSAKASGIASVFTKQTLSSTMNATSAPGTNVDYARNLIYQLSLTNGTASSAMISGGTFVAYGLDIQGTTISESVAFTRLAAASVPIQGSRMFCSVATLSFSNFSLATNSSSASNSVSFSVGVGNIIGLPQNARSSNVVPFAWIGTSIQYTTSHTASSSSNAYTVNTGPIGIAGVNFSNAVATNTPVQIYYLMNGVVGR